MPTIRQRIAKTLLREELDKVGQAYEMLVEGYRSGPAVLSPTTLAANLTELDSQLLDLIMRQRGWEPIIGSGAGGFYELTEADRIRAVNDSRHMYHFDVQYRRGIKSWTDFGFGQTFSVDLPNEKAQAIWDECATAVRNYPLFKSRHIQKLSNDECIDGEIFLVAYQSTVNGGTTWRRFKTEEISKIIYADDDKDVPLFYVRSEDGGDVYYPDYAAPEDVLDNYKLPAGVIRADQRGNPIDFIQPDQEITTEPATKVKVLHAAFETLNGRGWPIFNVSLPWARAYKNFLQDRATVARAVAAMVDEIIHKGGSRTQTELMNQIASTLSQTMPWDSNAPPVAGSTGVHNQGVEIKRRPLDTGAGDARTDGMTLLGQMAAGDGVPLHWRGRTDAMQNRATARETERPWLEAMQRYQTFWKDVIRDMVWIVLDGSGAEFDQNIVAEAEIFMQSPFVIYPDEAADAIGAITTAAQAGTLDYSIAQASIEILVGLVLTTYGTSNVRDIFENAQLETQEQSEKTNITSDPKDIFGYHIQEGIVSKNEVRRILGLPEIDETESIAIQKIKEKLSIVKAAVDAAVPFEQALILADLSLSKSGKQAEFQVILDVAKTAIDNFRDGETEPEQVIEYLYSTLQELL